MKCSKCEREYDDEFNFCPYCGRIKSGPRTSQPAGEPAGDRSETGPDSEKETEGHHLPPIGTTRIVLIAIAVLAIIGWVVATLMISGSRSTDINDTEKVAETFIHEISEDKYDAVFDLLDTSNGPIVGIAISEALGKKPEDIIVLKPGTDLKSMRTTREFIRIYLASIKKSFLANNTRSIGSRTLVPDKNIVVAVSSFDSDVPSPLMEIKSDGWKVDLATMLLMNARGTTPGYVIGSVEALLSKPTRSNCEKSIQIIKASEDMDEELGLWLMPESESMLSGDVITGISEGKLLTDAFDKLLAQAEKARKAAPEEPGEEPGEAITEEAVKPPPTITSLTGEGDQQAAPFNLKKGLVIFHYNHPGNYRFKATLLDNAGQVLKTLVESRGATAGSIAVGVSAGTYFLAVESYNPWTIEVEEPTASSAPFPPVNFAGSGHAATGFFRTRGGPVNIELDYQWSGDFVVTLMELGGRTVELVVSETGPYKSTHTVQLRSNVDYLFNLKAGGPWTIDVRQQTGP